MKKQMIRLAVMTAAISACMTVSALAAGWKTDNSGRGGMKTAMEAIPETSGSGLTTTETECLSATILTKTDMS